MAKIDQTKASRLLSATKTMSLGANKNSIRILYGNHVAENIDFRSEPQQHVKEGANKQVISSQADSLIKI
ncbi:hypothetical protein ACMWP3_22345, partial [Escherichia coli]